MWEKCGVLSSELSAGQLFRCVPVLCFATLMLYGCTAAPLLVHDSCGLWMRHARRAWRVTVCVALLRH